MAGGLQELRRRIRSAQNTQQITRAMKMVAGAKLRRAEERARQSREFLQEIRAVAARAAALGSGESRLLEERPLGRLGLLVITSDRGLAGPYNANVLRQAVAQATASAAEVAVLVVGRKGREFFRHRRYTILEEFVGLGDDPSYRQARAIADIVLAHFLEGRLDQVRLIYTRYINPMTQRPETVELLPVPRAELASQGPPRGYLFEPEPAEVLEELLPRFVEVQLYGALLESKASEHGARMTAMDSASKNAEELIRRLILMRNRLRQAAITREIAELVGGAEALE
ncbi:MAG: ATP synthase F1 subunit gamma [Firmicutes bacterium]|nr:ATP synthase F1 subunit gamma [Alicyclobacillaceae bacterium]MCL6497699.1 ATP synthase F1 subunit gamma [Bacillota bacterium]